MLLLRKSVLIHVLSLRVGLQPGPAPRGQREMGETGSRRVGGVFNKQEKWPAGLLLCAPAKTSTPTGQNLHSFYRGLTGVQSRVPSRWPQNISLSQGSLKQLLVQEEWAACTFQRQGRVKRPQLPRSSSWVNQWLHPLNDLLRQCATQVVSCTSPMCWETLSF